MSAGKQRNIEDWAKKRKKNGELICAGSSVTSAPKMSFQF